MSSDLVSKKLVIKRLVIKFNSHLCQLIRNMFVMLIYIIIKELKKFKLK